jgi:surface antigen
MTRESARTGSGPASKALYRASRLWREGVIMPRPDERRACAHLRRLAFTGIVCLPLAACSISMPLSPFGAAQEPLTTGSIGPVSPLADKHDHEDWRRARAALAVALDPQGSGTPVSWGNPESGNGGAFESASKAYVRDDRVCRDFAAELSFAEKPPRAVSGIACRMSETDWRIDTLAPRGDAAGRD